MGGFMMAICNKCGNEVNNGVIFCPKCGAIVGEQTTQNNNVQPPQYQGYHQYYQQQNLQQQQFKIDTTGIWVWSVINLFLCWPFSVYSGLTLLRVNKATTRSEAERLYNSAKTACIIATTVGIILIIIALALE